MLLVSDLCYELSYMYVPWFLHNSHITHFQLLRFTPHLVNNCRTDFYYSAWIHCCTTLDLVLCLYKNKFCYTFLIYDQNKSNLQYACVLSYGHKTHDQPREANVPTLHEHSLLRESNLNPMMWCVGSWFCDWVMQPKPTFLNSIHPIWLVLYPMVSGLSTLVH